MNYADILRGEVEALEAERSALLDELDTLTVDETRSAEVVESRADEIVERGTAILAEVEAKVARITELDAIKAERASVPTSPNFIRKEKATGDDFRSMSTKQLVDAVTRNVEERDIDPDYARSLFKRHQSDRQWLAGLATRSTEVYESAWAKAIMGRQWDLTAEERTALSTTTSANGDYLVPTHLDPTVILTNNGSSNVMRSLARTVTLTRPGDSSWQGITSAGVDASFDGQLVEVSDDSPTFAQPTVPVWKAQALVQASIEASEDIPGLANEILMMFADAKDRLEATAHMTGAGTTGPTGIFTALDANTNVEIVSDTAAGIFKADLNEMYTSVPVRFRRNATWVMHPTWAQAIQDLGTAVSNSYSADLTEGPANRLFNKAVVESDEAPSASTTTVRDNRIAFGDFSNYVIVDKPGSFSVEYIPHLFAVANNLPDGRRGWYAYWRTGGDSVNDLAFRLLQDKTSA